MFEGKMQEIRASSISAMGGVMPDIFSVHKIILAFALSTVNSVTPCPDAPSIAKKIFFQSALEIVRTTAFML